MKFDLALSIQILERTPAVLQALLGGLAEAWTLENEGENSWSAFDIVGHLIQGEKKDWLPRTEIILNRTENKAFEPFDRFAQFEASKGKTLTQLLTEFKHLRAENILLLRSLQLTETDLDKTGQHPAFGEVTLRQHLATWTVHDLGHISQITRVMAKQLNAEVGPWLEYLPVLQK
ncbi:DinB family protein [Adhaeribacter terreus]|uniref:DinB family protein n=1 Tax=Adhaeribacter terreus TaxID=529703 RepID=A0ABW0EHV0_9BACT